MNSTSTIHVIETTTPPQEIEDVKKPPPSEDELQQFMISFGLAIKKDKGQPFRKIMQRLGQRENLENIAATCPELTKDPIARYIPIDHFGMLLVSWLCLICNEL